MSFFRALFIVLPIFLALTLILFIALRFFLVRHLVKLMDLDIIEAIWAAEDGKLSEKILRKIQEKNALLAYDGLRLVDNLQSLGVVSDKSITDLRQRFRENIDETIMAEEGFQIICNRPRVPILRPVNKEITRIVTRWGEINKQQKKLLFALNYIYPIAFSYHIQTPIM